MGSAQVRRSGVQVTSRVSRESDEDYVLRWPVDLFKQELAALLNQRDGLDRWGERCELLLADAFALDTPRETFVDLSDSGGGWGAPTSSSPSNQLTRQQRWLAELLRRADHLPIQGERRLYFSERKAGGGAGLLAVATAVSEFSRLVHGLQDRGYFEQRFGKDCVDDPTDVDPAEIIRAQLPRDGLWPLDASRLSQDTELFLDLIEVLYDLVSAPQTRYHHSYGGCGWHHGNFSTRVGRAVYLWEVNRLLTRSILTYRLSDTGEDRGRVVTASDEPRSQLAATLADPDHDATEGTVPHAIALFRARGAGRPEKRSACVALAGILEERRSLLKQHLLRPDEGALFQIANQFAIRHQNARQLANYDEAFLDWIFWTYLSTIDLTNHLLDRPEMADL